jgi:hypothetical protein
MLAPPRKINMAKLFVPNFKNNQQEEPDWCWAAVAANVNNAVGKPPIQQCEVVLKIIPTPAPPGVTACANAKATLGNRQSDLKGALEKLKLFPHGSGRGNGPSTSDRYA